MKNLLKLFFEIGILKNIRRSGWFAINIKNPESIAEHSFRCAIIGYFLSKMEKADTEKIVTMCLFHDISETRMGDFNILTKKYVKNHERIEEMILEDQIKPIDQKWLLSLMKEYNSRKTKEAIIAKDADLLECAIQAKEYFDMGYEKAKIWIENVKRELKTESAKKILLALEKSDSTDWWKDLL